MANTIPTKPATKTPAPTAASKSVKQGETIKISPVGENQGSEVAASKKVTIPNSPDGADTPPADAGTPGKQLATTGTSHADSDSAAEVKDLTPAESSRFTELQTLIRSGLKKVNRLRLQMAAALAEIRDKELYRGGYPTFEAFCAAEVSLMKSHAHALANAGGVYRDLQSAMADKSTLPANERQMRPLTRLKLAKQRAKAWRRAVELAKDKKLTEAHVRRAVNEIELREKTTTPPPPPEHPTPVTAWRDRLVTKFTAMGFEQAFEQPIKWLSDAVALYSPGIERYVKLIDRLDFTEAACALALKEKGLPCLIVVNAGSNTPDGIQYAAGDEPAIKKESFPQAFHVMAQQCKVVLEMHDKFYRASEMDDSFKTNWAPVSYLDLELPDHDDEPEDQTEAAD